ncbi:MULTISPECIES: hypothetical protein [unclassified Streptomyces]|uniref:hypothetical protein n=1 Tax=unclassified Streptomyces TaxID=2593676 RepID=UPI0033B0D8F0
MQAIWPFLAGTAHRRWVGAADDADADAPDDVLADVLDDAEVCDDAAVLDDAEVAAAPDAGVLATDGAAVASRPPVTRAAADSTATAVRRTARLARPGCDDFNELPSMGGSAPEGVRR